MLYINFSLLVNLIIELFNPNSGWEQSDGESRRVMETNWIWGEIAAFILSPLALLAYHKTKMGHSVIEIGVTVLLVVVTLVVYLFWGREVSEQTY